MPVVRILAVTAEPSSPDEEGPVGRTGMLALPDEVVVGVEVVSELVLAPIHVEVPQV